MRSGSFCNWILWYLESEWSSSEPIRALWNSEDYDIWSTHGLRQGPDRKINLHPFIDRLSLTKCFRCHVFVVTVFSNYRIRNRRLLTVRWCPGIVPYRLRILAASLCLLFKRDSVSRLNIYMLTKSNRFHFASRLFFEAQSWFTSSFSYCFLIDVVSSKI